MSRRYLRILFVLFQAAWLNAVLPGHTRGIVTVPGYERADSVASSACCATRASANGQPESESSDRRQKERAAHCAVCAFAARLSTPPAIVTAVAPLAFVRITPPAVAETLCTAPSQRTYDGRGPPAA